MVDSFPAPGSLSMHAFFDLLCQPMLSIILSCVCINAAQLIYMSISKTTKLELKDIYFPKNTEVFTPQMLHFRPQEC